MGIIFQLNVEIGLTDLPKTEGSKDPDNFPEQKGFLFVDLDLIYIPR